MYNYWITFISSFAFIALRAFQQLNVVHNNRILIIPTSLLMAACETVVIVNVARNGFGIIVLFTGFGAGIGALFAMWLHQWLMKKKV